MTFQNDESPLRSMMAEAHGFQYTSLSSLDEARQVKDSYLVMEGDDGGQIYFVCPVTFVNCHEHQLNLLLGDIDELAWKDMSMAKFYFEIHEPDTAVSGGMGGGRADMQLWVHDRLKYLEEEILSVLKGAKARINPVPNEA